MHKITDSVYGIFTRFGYLNQYLIVNGDAITVVDMLLGPADIDRLASALAAQGWTLAQVQHVLITHAHRDHAGGLATFQRRSNAPTYAHRRAAAVIRGTADPAPVRPDEFGFFNRLLWRIIAASPPPAPARVDVELAGGDPLNHISDSLQAVHLPGHSPGQLGYHLRRQKLLFGGDVMMRAFGTLRMPLRAATSDWQSAVQSLRIVQQLDIDILCLGHGRPLFNAQPHIARLLRQHPL